MSQTLELTLIGPSLHRLERRGLAPPDGSKLELGLLTRLRMDPVSFLLRIDIQREKRYKVT
ncbi:MAG: hypothetical protein A2W09_00915 [Deltaproteobacteria bacterium RBG_16_50_11]|nr:MAG: hypothetical protein A2W09_00915 [Deltaproteobacteria bacterium RBG_16_50_11]